MIQTMVIHYTQRISWPDLPAELRELIESHLGSQVITAHSQYGGFSAGSADRLLTAAGQKVFAKAVSHGLNGPGAALHAREAEIAAMLPASMPVPKFLGRIRWDDWEALIFDQAPGVNPQLPWGADELIRVLDTLAQLADQQPAGITSLLPALEVDLREDASGFARIMADEWIPADPWLAQNLEALHELAIEGIGALAGNQLVHTDLHSDNILLGEDGGVLLVDWPWASRGAAWYDALTVLVEARIFDPALDADAIASSHRIFASASSDALTGALAGLAAYYVDAARRPEVPELPTLRSYHAKQATACVAWLKARLG